MKKVLLKLSALALLLTASVGMYAQITDDLKGLAVKAISSEQATSITPTEQWYLVKQDRGGLTPIYDNGEGNNIMRNADDNSLNLNENITDATSKYLVRFIPSIGNAYNIQFGTGRYFGSDLKSSATAGDFLVYPTTEGGNVFGINKTSDGTSYGDRVDNNGAGSNLSFWGSNQVTDTSGNNVWKLYAVTLEEDATLADIIYLYKYNDVEVYRETKSGVIGYPLPAPTVKPYGVTYDNPMGTVTGDATIDIDVTIRLPFDFSDSYANVETWYTLANHTSKYLLKYQEDQTAIPLDETTQTGNTYAYAWAFVGDPFNGFEIVNNLAGSSKVLSNIKDFGNNDGTTYPLLKEKSSLTATDVCKYFITQGNFTNGFYIGYTDTNNRYVRMNNRSGKLAYWAGGADNGSTFTVSVTEISNLKDITYIYKENGTEVARETLQGTIGESLPVPTIPYGVSVIGSLPTGTVSTEATYDINVEISMPFVYTGSYDHISQWYNIEFHSNKHRYMYYSNGIKFATSNDGTNVNYMWAFVGNPFDGFQIYNKAAGNSVALDSNNPCGISAAGTTCEWKVYATTENVEKGFCIKVDGQQYVNIQGQDDSTNPNGGDLKRWKDADAGSTAQVIAAAMPISDFVNSKAFQAVAPRATLCGDDTQLLTQETTGNDATSDELFAIIKSDEGNYYLYSIGAQKFVTYKGQNVGDVSLVESGMKSVVVTTDGKNGSPYRFKFQSNYLNINSQKNVVISDWKTADDGNSFQFIDNGAYDLSDAIAAANSYESPTKTLTDYGYATLYTDHNVAIPEGATAYYVTVDDNVATLNEIEDVIPANTGVVVKGTGSTDYQFAYTTTAATTNVSDNKMTGFIVDTPITGDDATSYYAVNYKTVGGEKVPGFFAPKGASTPTGSFTAVGGKAYLKVEGTAGSSIVMRFGDATMVENLLQKQENAAIYDLTGRKVAQPERGIYIVNGKKMFFK